MFGNDSFFIRTMIDRNFVLKYIRVVALVVLCLVSFRAAATTSVGCLSSNTTYTYINEESNSVRNNHRYDDDYSSSDQSGHINRTFYHREEYDRNLTASNFCVTPITPSVACFIHATRSGYISSPGTLVNYSTVNNCNVPIDDYIPFLLVSIAGISVYFLRGRFITG